MSTGPKITIEKSNHPIFGEVYIMSPSGDIYNISPSVDSTLLARDLLNKLDALVKFQSMAMIALERDIALLEAEKEILKAEREIDKETFKVELKQCKDKLP